MFRHKVMGVVLAILLLEELGGAAAGDCGKPGGPCGKSLPAGSPCAKSPGFCQPGHYCASCVGNGDWCKDTRSLCRPLPPGCGSTAATFCCPPNAGQPMTANSTLAPSCAKGLTCQYFKQGPWRNNPADPFAANYLQNENYGECIQVAADCGRPGKTCCPNPYHTAFNPQPPGYLCWGGKAWSNATFCDGQKGVCVSNAPGCGSVGRPCCVSDGGPSTDNACQPGAGGAGGLRGKGFYCTDSVPGGPPGGMCTRCPAGYAKLFKADSWEYIQCHS